ncbi:MAG: N-acetylmuramoyl-L-alanine amidase [Alistipes sp.]|nr:N-acetylmuramoyl-L-alanine amidase [Alistipes sp.]
MRVRIFQILLALTAAVWTNVATAQPAVHGVQVVVIDAGHGGDDPGAHYFGTCEKTLTLEVALKLGKLIEEGMPGVKVVYTRKTDKALAATKLEDLQARADIANKAGGDLFVSIHVNAAPVAAARGTETLIMGETPKEQRYNEDALYENNRDDLIDMSDERTAAIVRAYIQNLQFTYGEYSTAMARCIQNNYVKLGRSSRGVKPQLLRVLYATDMPGVLTEIGFLSNPQEAAYMKSEKGQNEIARSLFNAVKDYSAYVLETRKAESAETPPPAAASGKPEKEAAPAKTADPKTKGAPKPAETKTKAAPKQKAPETKSKPAPAAKPDAKGKSEAPQPVAKASGDDKERFAIQVLSSKSPVARNSPELRNYSGDVREYLADGVYRYKYCVCECATKEEAQRRIAAVRKTFPDAFIVRCRGGRIVK